MYGNDETRVVKYCTLRLAEWSGCANLNKRESRLNKVVRSKKPSQLLWCGLPSFPLVVFAICAADQRVEVFRSFPRPPPLCRSLSLFIADKERKYFPPTTWATSASFQSPATSQVCSHQRQPGLSRKKRFCVCSRPRLFVFDFFFYKVASRVVK